MNGHLERSNLIELARGRLSGVNERSAVAAHVRVCRDCRLFMEEQLALTAALEGLAHNALSDACPPADLESILVSEFVSRRAWYRRPLKLAAAIGAIAAAVAGLVAIPRGHIAGHIAAPSPRSQPAVLTAETAAIPRIVNPSGPPVRKAVVKPVRKRPAETAADAAPFTAIPYTVPLDPRERAIVMRMELPVTALAAVGLAVAAPDPRAQAQTDVIVGEDGRIRAILLLSVSTSNTDRSINQ
jgi:hypothetical protein